MSTRIEIGNVTIHRIVEQEGPFFGAMHFFPTMTKELLDENRSWLRPKFLDASDRLMLCIQSYVVRTPHHTIMIDSCVGNHKPRPDAAVLEHDEFRSLREEPRGQRIRRERNRFCHVHASAHRSCRVEHAARERPVGADLPEGALRIRRPRTCPLDQAHQDDPAACPWITDSVLPIVAANRVDIVKSAHAFNELVTLIPTPGHTIDHYSVQVGKPGADAIITGDMIHSPLQARYPETSHDGGFDPDQSAESRRELFERFCDTSTLMCTAHFPSPSRAALCAGAMRSISLIGSSLNLPGDNSVYRTVCWMLRWPR